MQKITKSFLTSSNKQTFSGGKLSLFPLMNTNISIRKSQVFSFKTLGSNIGNRNDYSYSLNNDDIMQMNREQLQKLKELNQPGNEQLKKQLSIMQRLFSMVEQGLNEIELKSDSEKRLLLHNFHKMANFYKSIDYSRAPLLSIGESFSEEFQRESRTYIEKEECVQIHEMFCKAMFALLRCVVREQFLPADLKRIFPEQATLTLLQSSGMSMLLPPELADDSYYLAAVHELILYELMFLTSPRPEGSYRTRESLMASCYFFALYYRAHIQPF